jgi:hypothetical protein
MAWIWHGVVNCSSRATAEAVARQFDRSSFRVPQAGTVDLRLGVEHTSSGWECGICPYVWTSEEEWWHLNDHGGALTTEEALDIDCCADVIYRRLQETHGYRFALTGFEVADWRSAGGLLDDISPGGLYEQQRRDKLHGYCGLVISSALAEAAEYPQGFVPFGPPTEGMLGPSTGYSWIPYRATKVMVNKP